MVKESPDGLIAEFQQVREQRFCPECGANMVKVGCLLVILIFKQKTGYNHFLNKGLSRHDRNVDPEVEDSGPFGLVFYPLFLQFLRLANAAISVCFRS